MGLLSRQTISTPTLDDLESMAAQVVRVQILLDDYLTGATLASDGSDLDLIQALLESGAISPDDTDDLRCLGMVLGMEIARALEEVDWVMVEDEISRDPAL